MRIVVSDFDGTLKPFHGSMDPAVVDAIRRWRAGGNAFGIATGRDRVMTLMETERSRIPYDFLVLINGAALYDGAARLLDATLIDDDLVEPILRHPAALASEHYQLIDLKAIYLYERRETFFGKFGIPNVPVDVDAALALRDLAQISFWYQTADEALEWARRLDADFPGRIAAHANTQAIDITRRGVDKAEGIRRVLALLGYADAEVFAIGDGGNDVGMIREYNGATVPDGAPAAKEVARRVYADVGAMLDDLMREA